MTPEPQNGDRVFPTFLKLAGRKVVLVGAGPVAAAKLRALKASQALVTVVAPEVAPDHAPFFEEASEKILRRPFVAADLDGAWFVVAAAPPEVNRAVAAAAEERHLFVNAADDRAAASAYLGSVVRRGGVTVAISTEGAAPALAGLLREGIDALLPEDLDGWVTTARELRPTWRAAGVKMDDRRPLLLEALNRRYQDRSRGEPVS